MEQKAYLKTHIPQFIRVNTNKKYWIVYGLIKLRRFFVQTLMIFIFQYLIISNLSFSFPISPMYPPIGVAFVMFYLLGNNAILGLLLGGLLGYLLKGLPVQLALLYLIADIGGGYLGSLLSQRIFSSDIRPFANLQEVFVFLKINAFITCFFSALVRIGAICLKQNISFYDCLDLWIADLNGVLTMSGFLLSWAYVPFSREKISEKPVTVVVVVVIIFTLFSAFFMKNAALAYLIAGAMISSICISYYYGYLIATGLLFIISAIYLSHFMALKQQYMHCLGLEIYTLFPILLFVFSVGILYTGHYRIQLKRI